MKRYKYLSIPGLILCLTFVTQAQVRRVPVKSAATGTAPSSELRFSDTESYVRNDTLFIAFRLTVQGRVISSGEGLHIVPVYRAGRESLRFPEILIHGKKRARYYRREQTLLSHEEYWAQKPYATMTLSEGHPQDLSYFIAEPLPASMREGGTLNIEQFVEDCCDLRLAGDLPLTVETRQTDKKRHPELSSKVETVVSRPIYESSVTFIRPKKEVVKERNERLTVRINYPVDRYDVLPHYADNARELQKVDQVLRPLSSKGETYQIRHASIRGYASPEAPYQYNLKLSQRRADGFKQYLINRYGLYNLGGFTAQGMGEDWDGLRAAVAGSGMDYRAEVLSIIDGVSIFNGREKMLMDLAGGKPYHYMLHTLYPPLRRMEMEIAYTVRSFETREAEEMLGERPQDLSQEEIYEVARKRNSDNKARTRREEYGREYDLAAKYFPDDATANINASSAALVRGDLDEAWGYLSKIQHIPEAYNNLGVYHWLRGDTVRAEQYFRKALQVKGDEEKAGYNLKLLREYLREK